MTTAAEVANTIEHDARRDADQEREDLLDEYVGVLRTQKPPRGEGLSQFLRKVKAGLGLSNEDIGRDHEIVRRVVGLQELVARDGDLIERRRKVGRKVADLRRDGVSGVDLARARGELAALDEECRQATNALARLKRLAHDYPRLFRAGNPPTLR